MRKNPVLAIAASGLMLLSSAAQAAPAGDGRFHWSTKSEEAKALLAELQGRIESFQFGPQNAEIAKKIVAADPQFAMGHYYLAATSPAGNLETYQKARELAAKASDGERRFIEAMQPAFVNQGAAVADAIGPLEAVARDYPNERLVFVVLGQVYNGANRADDARRVLQRAREVGPPSLRVETLLANDELLRGNYAAALATFQSVESRLPRGSVPFGVRFGTTFGHLYEGRVDAALASLRTYLDEYHASGSDQAFPDVFIWNAIARINLESGRLDEAMKAYEKGYESVPGSSLPEDQKQIWYGRLRHGKARTLAKMGKSQEAWAEAEAIREMIEKGGEPAKQFWPAYHYLAGYVKLEAGDAKAAAEHLEQADPQNPFHTLLLARAYEKLGRTADAKKSYEAIVASKWPGIERPLSFPEAKRKLQSS